MTKNEETHTKSTARKIAQVPQDALALIGYGMAVYGLGKLAYDATKFGVNKFKSRKTNDEK